MLAHMISIQTVTDGISRRVTSGLENTILILVFHGVRVSGLLKTVVITRCCYNSHCPPCVKS